jgi:hypothetical protein
MAWLGTRRDTRRDKFSAYALRPINPPCIAARIRDFRAASHIILGEVELQPATAHR